MPQRFRRRAAGLFAQVCSAITSHCSLNQRDRAKKIKKEDITGRERREVGEREGEKERGENGMNNRVREKEKESERERWIGEENDRH